MAEYCEWDDFEDYKDYRKKGFFQYFGKRGTAETVWKKVEVKNGGYNDFFNDLDILPDKTIDIHFLKTQKQQPEVFY